ncbi:MAG: hypothetical protein WHS64_02115 [Fervidobacterium sp.]|uniref:hypothetical protein n=1 Tax=Fervidobacterium sp. TaxID=1871331 RepID=UPI0021FFF602|nr:hypothetical protein IB67_07920 [Fervidobacterium riparium]
MEGKLIKDFAIRYELDILSKKIKINGEPEEDVKSFLSELKAKDDPISKRLYRDIIESAITEMRTMGWQGMDIKNWLRDVGFEE